jgi:hypothetical protein
MVTVTAMGSKTAMVGHSAPAMEKHFGLETATVDHSEIAMV